jgi:hypothetical protein
MPIIQQVHLHLLMRKIFSSNYTKAALKNLTTVDWQTAPLPL